LRINFLEREMAAQVSHDDSHWSEVGPLSEGLLRLPFGGGRIPTGSDIIE
jgi:hypothetical protein